MAYGFTGNVAADPHWLIFPAGVLLKMLLKLLLKLKAPILI